MSFNIALFCFSSLLLVNLTGAKPVTSLQSLMQLLDGEMNAGSEMMMEEQVEQQDPVSSRAELERLLGDLVTASKRSWSRFKKGGLRSCFGVRLERIGSFSGLGC